jgi:CPA2 family monovalent cation:H+ antiporter-2
LHDTLLILIITIAISTIVNVLLKRFDIPTVIGYVLTGFTITSIFHFAEDSKLMLSHLAEFGIVFLMFTIGLEFSINHLKSMKKEVFVYGGLEVLVVGSVFFAIAYYIFHLDMRASIIIGFALALSSTAIVLKILNENNQIHSGYGRITLGILLFQDIAVIPILLMVSFFTQQDKSVVSLMVDSLVGAIVIFVVMYIVGRYFIEKFFDWILDTRSEEIFLVAILLGVMSASYMAQALGFTYSLGAFLAGMILSETKYRYKIEADLIPFRDILLGVFFITIGMLIDWHSLVKYAHIIILLVMALMFVKGSLIYIILRGFTQTRTALKSSLALLQVGEFALAVLALAKSHSLISVQTNQILIVSVVFSMILTPFILKNIKSIASIFTTEPETLRQRAIESTGFENHVIICGYGEIGEMIVDELKHRDILYVILEHDIKIVDKLLETTQEPIFYANAARRNVLEHFNIDKCSSIIVAIENETQRRLICENIVTFSKDIKSVVIVRNKKEEVIFEEMGISSVVNTRDMIASQLTKEALSCKI